MSKILIKVDASKEYVRYVTGVDGIPQIDTKDDVTVLEMVMPEAKGTKIQWAEAPGATQFERWLTVQTNDDPPVSIPPQISGTLNFVTGDVQPGTNEIQIDAGADVTVTVYQYDPATPQPVDSKVKNRNMVFDFSKYGHAA